MPRDGNDLEALQIHLCFCRSNLHPRRAARSGSTLVFAFGAGNRESGGVSVLFHKLGLTYLQQGCMQAFHPACQSLF
ncbi:hypothetical protein EPR50_G00007470 [Perca flavescens]|uniref:Uncharacterized protein n=2 Tax=Perca TaxID=8166 RepID=A0A6A5EUX0_PERFL|nr:hypothetical protein PFLUV_G00035380 [Perca fluviatilis]TDH17334.1 hypothetical protein EPR50_G00007470 [Perca flavescens]